MSRIAVKMDSDTVAVTGVEELDQHLDELVTDTTTDLRPKLFDDVELQLTDANIPPLIPRLLPKITEILKQYQKDPSVICSLAIKLLGPLNFTQVMSMASEDAINLAMRSPAPSANLLAMAILEKAAKSPSEAAILAMMTKIVANFVTQWLSAPQVEVGEKGSRILGDILDIDCELRPPQGLATNGTEIAVRKPPGQGLMWRRIFHDRDIYGLILSLCSAGPHQRLEGGLSDQQLTLAQGRLLRIMPRLAALNLGVVSRTEFVDLNQQYARLDSDEGLLQFAALSMIDREDLLMHMNLIDFFETLLGIQSVTPFSTYKMDTLKNLLRDATLQDSALKSAIVSLPDRTIPEEAEYLRKFIRSLI